MREVRWYAAAVAGIDRLNAERDADRPPPGAERPGKWFGFVPPWDVEAYEAWENGHVERARVRRNLKRMLRRRLALLAG